LVFYEDHAGRAGGIAHAAAHATGIAGIPPSWSVSPSWQPSRAAATAEALRRSTVDATV